MALDAIATPTILDGSRARGGERWVITGHDTDASTAIEIKAAPGAGKSLLIDAAILTSNDVDAYPQLQDEDDNVIFGRFHTTLTEGGFVLAWRFPNPLKLVSNKALELKAAAAGNVSVYVEGRTIRDPA